jgi:hypothetical protein
MRGWLFGLGLAMLAIAGCGGSSKAKPSDTSPASNAAAPHAGPPSYAIPSGTPLTLPKLIVSADAICERHNITRSAAKTVIETSSELKRVGLQRAVVEQAALVELSKLVPPISIESQWQQFLGYRRVLVDSLRKVSKGATRDGVHNVLASVNGAQASMLSTARRVGLNGCSRLG